MSTYVEKKIVFLSRISFIFSFLFFFSSKYCKKFSNFYFSLSKGFPIHISSFGIGKQFNALPKKKKAYRKNNALE